MTSINEAKQLVDKVQKTSLRLESLIEKYFLSIKKNDGGNNKDMNVIEIKQLKKQIEELTKQKENVKTRLDRLISTIQDTLQVDP